MAKFYTVWAKQAGNYDDVTDEGHIWMYYDYDEPVEENRIKEYKDANNNRIIPQPGDTVYTNGFIVNFAAASNNTMTLIGTRDGERCVGTFRNDVNPYTGLSGGYFLGGTYNGNKSISGNCVSGNDSARLFYIYGSNTTLYAITLTADTIEIGNNYLIQSNASTNGGRRALYVTSQSIVFNGNGCLAGNFYLFGVVSVNSPIIRLHGSGGLLHSTTASSSTTTITGNITSDDDASAYVFYYTFGAFRTTINGSVDFSNSNCTLQHTAITNTQNAWSLVITGNVKTSNNMFIIQNTTSSLTFQGDVEAKGALTGNVGTCQIYGDLIQYSIRTIGAASSTIRIVGDIYLYGASRICNTCSIQMTLEGDKLYFEDATTPLGGLYGALSVPENWKIINGSNINPIIVLSRVEFDNTDQYPAESNVKKDVKYAWGEKVGTYQQPPEAVVLKDYVYDNGERTGTLENEVTINVGCTNPQDVRKDIPLANMGIVGTMVIPSPENVLEGTIYDNGTEGTLESQSTADYPAEDKVLIGTSYDHDNMTGSLEPGGDNPQESDVRFGVPYNHNLNIGKAHIPSSQDVRKNVPVEDTVGQIVIPRASEVKKDVEFDIDSVGTLESTVQTNNTINVYRKR